MAETPSCAFLVRQTNVLLPEKTMGYGEISVKCKVFLCKGH